MSTPRSVLVVWEGGRSAERLALAAADVAGQGDVELELVAFAPQGSERCCGTVCQAYYNDAVREEVRSELADATRLLGPLAERATLTLLVEGTDPPLAKWARGRSFDLVLVAQHRLAVGRHLLVRALRRATGGEVRLVSVGRRAARVPATSWAAPAGPEA